MIVTLKAHRCRGLADRMAPLLGPETAVVTAVNGVPWWYFYGLERPARAASACRASIPAAAVGPASGRSA